MAKALEAFVELSEDEGLKAYEEAKYIQDEIIANRTAYAVDEAVKKTLEEERKKTAYQMAYAVDEAREEERKKTAYTVEKTREEERKKAAYTVEKTREEERKKTALSLLEGGMSLQFIQTHTGLSEETIRNLKKS